MPVVIEIDSKPTREHETNKYMDIKELNTM